MTHYASFNIYQPKKKRKYKMEKGIKPKPFQKYTNLKLGILILFLVYSLLMGSGILCHHSKVLTGRVRPILAKPFAQKTSFPIVCRCEIL